MNGKERMMSDQDGVAAQDLQEFYETKYERSLEITSTPHDDDFLYSAILRQVRPYMHPGLDVLDLGCNNGNLSFYMANCGCNVLGIDLARNAVDTAQQSAVHLGINNARFESLDFLRDWRKPEAFDLVLCISVIEHIPHDDQFLEKIAYALRPGGRLVLFTCTTYSSLVYVNKLLYGTFAFDEEVGHLRRYTREGLCSLTEAAGFSVDNTVMLDSFLREWFILVKPLRVFNKIWKLKYIRTAFNSLDSLIARRVWPAGICVHALRQETP